MADPARTAHFPAHQDPPAGAPLTLSVVDAARLAGIGRGTMYRLVRTGQIRHLTVGSRIRIPRDAVAEWIATTAR